ncbi:MAG TPA: HAD family hydrolase [Archaeoglobaceae archaeon]|nr:HAD family hydrolase [Archaeoglobaceae archaeon]
MKFDTFIFDLDGTLVEFNLDFDEIRKVLNIREKYVLESLMRLDEETRNKKMQKLKELEIEAAKRAKPIPFAEYILIKLDENGYKKGIVTRNCRESLDVVLSRFDFKLDFFITREDAEPKPSPAPVLLAIKKAKSSPERSILIGDYKFDLMSGKSAGIKTVLLLTEKNRENAGEFMHMADYIIESLDEIEKFI